MYDFPFYFSSSPSFIMALFATIWFFLFFFVMPMIFLVAIEKETCKSIRIGSYIIFVPYVFMSLYMFMELWT